MKQRILTGWTLSRIMYLALGVLIMIQAALEKQFIGIPFGMYFALMGIFAFGCAGGNCYGTNCKTSSDIKEHAKKEEPTFEEVN